MDTACGRYELIVDSRGAVIEAGPGVAALCHAAPEDLVGRPVTRFLRGPAMTARGGCPASVTLKSPQGDRPGVGLRHIEGDRIRFVVLPAAEGSIQTAIRQVNPRVQEVERLIDEVVRAVHNPLTGIIGFSALAHLAPTPHRRRYYLDQVATQAQRCRRFVETLGASVKRCEPLGGPVDAGEAVRRAVGSMRVELEGHGIAVDVQTPGAPVWVRAEDRTIDDVVVTLIRRGTLGMRKIHRARDVHVACERTDGGAAVRIELTGATDPSPGLRHRFELPTAQTKGNGNLSAVELSLAYDQLRALGGDIRVEESADGEAVSVSLELIACEAPPAVDASRTPVPLDILAIDDDTMMGELYAELLGASGHTVTACRSLRSAREALRNQRFDAVITDFFLKDGTFPELWAEASGLHPELDRRVVVITGHTSNPLVREWLARSEAAVLAKPFTAHGLLTKITRMTM